MVNAAFQIATVNESRSIDPVETGCGRAGQIERVIDAVTVHKGSGDSPIYAAVAAHHVAVTAQELKKRIRSHIRQKAEGVCVRVR